MKFRSQIPSRSVGVRTVLATPLLREGIPIGAILIRRLEVRPFSAKQIKLLETFADQAVIAIENVRLFQELQERTGELARSVEELKALGEVGQAVSCTLDLQTVLSTIIGRAVQLSGTDCGIIYEDDEPTQEFHLRANYQMRRAGQRLPGNPAPSWTRRYGSVSRNQSAVPNRRSPPRHEVATRGCAPSCSALAINRCSQFRSFSIRKSWGL